MSTIDFKPEGRDAFVCSLSTRAGAQLTLRASVAGTEPELSGDPVLLGNPTIVTNVWAYGKHEAQYRRTRAAEKRKSHAKRAVKHKTSALAAARYAERLSGRSRSGWCSGCFMESPHLVVKTPATTRLHLCESCGALTSVCRLPSCRHMATRRLDRIDAPGFCAEHRHEIPGFDKLNDGFNTIDESAEWLKFDSLNAAKLTKVAAVSVLGAGLLGPAALAAAPAIGGAAGAMTGLTGAAATSHGLALFGGGSLAAGGLGMAGGTAVITAVGGALGGVIGATTTSAYVRSDPSFRIEKLRDGTGTPVLLASGFLTEKDDGWGGWRPVIDGLFPDAPVYRVFWGAKELKAIGVLLGMGAGQEAARLALVKWAARASKAGAGKVGPFGALLLGAGLAKNPWSVARSRAAMTGAILADLIARTETENFILVGHSLGARVMVTTAQALGTRDEAPRIDEVHLLGAAVGSKGEWRTLSSAVSGNVYNYWSSKDAVLKFLYRTVEGGRSAAGVRGFNSSFANIKDRSVTRQVSHHSAYFDAVKLAGGK